MVDEPKQATPPTASDEKRRGPLATVRSRLRRLADAPRARVGIPVAALAAMALSLAVQFAYTEQSSIDGLWRGFALAALVFGAVTLLLNVSQRYPGDEAEAPAIALSRRAEFGILAAIIAVAAFYRFFRFMSFPPGLWFDEGVVGTDAIYIIEKDHFTVWQESNYGKATPYLYLIAASIKMFGHTVFAMRVVPAIAGLAAVIAFYFLCRRLAGVAPALLATAMLATSRWAVTFGRISWDAAMVPLMATASMFFLLKALDTRDKRWFLLAGGTLAAGLYTYTSFRIVPVVIAALVVYAAITEWPTIRRNIGGLALYVVASIVVIAPFAHFTLTHQDLVLERTREVNVFREVEDKDSWQPLRSNIDATIEMMNVKGDPNGRHNIPHAPMLDEVTGALFVLGIAVCIASIGLWRRGGLVWWYLLALVPGALTITQDNPSAIRDIGALPPIYLMIGLTFATLHRSLAPIRMGTAAFIVLGVALVSASGAINYYDLFERQAADQRVYDAFTPWSRHVGEIIAERGDDNQFHVSHRFSHEPPVSLLAHDYAFERYSAGMHLIFPDDGKPHVLIADEHQFGIVPTLRRLYPNLTTEDWVDPWGRRPFTRITLPAADLKALHELPLTIVRPSGTETTTGRIDRAWTEDDLTNGPFIARWEGYLWSNGAHTLRTINVSAPGPIFVKIDDGAPFESESGALSIPPALRNVGEHRVSIEAQIDRPGAVSFGFGEFSGADELYAPSTGDRGFAVLYRESEDFASEPIARSQVPFAVPVDAHGRARTIEYQGLLNVPAGGGLYRFALDGLISQLLVDGQLVVDNGGRHGPVRVEGSVDLEPGQHFVSIQFIVDDEPDLAVHMMKPGDDIWSYVDGSEFRVPPPGYRPPGVVRLIPDESWGPGGVRRIEGLGDVRAVDVFPDGTLLAATTSSVAVLDADTNIIRQFDAVGSMIADVVALDDGGIVIADSERKVVVVINADGSERRRYADLNGATGVAVLGDSIYIASPSGATLYRALLSAEAKGEFKLNGLKQPADVAVAPDGTLFVADFESRQILRSNDERTVAATYIGVTGSGDQLPHLAIRGDLLFATDSTTRRVAVYALETGRLRGTLVFSPATVIEPTSIAATDDGRLYVVNSRTGEVHRLIVEEPPPESPPVP